MKIQDYKSFNENLGTPNDNNETEKFNKLSYKEKINFLIKTFGMDKDEAYEICQEDTTVDELPDEIKVYFEYESVWYNIIPTQCEYNGKVYRILNIDMQGGYFTLDDVDGDNYIGEIDMDECTPIKN